MAIRSIEDPRELRVHLGRDRAGCAFLLGCLDRSVSEGCRWWGVFDDQTHEPQLILVLFEGLSTPVIMTVGASEHLEALLTELHGSIPVHFRCLIEEDHKESLAIRYEDSGLSLSTRLVLTRDAHDTMPEDPYVVRLSDHHTPDINVLLDKAESVDFEPYQLDTGYCFGFFDQAGGQLVSMSGIHLFSEENDIALLGQVFTLPPHRRIGLAYRVVGRQLNEVFKKVSLVAVNVPVDNEPALELFDCHHFEPRERYWEGWVRLRY